jgi:hypothetical protein
MTKIWKNKSWEAAQTKLTKNETEARARRAHYIAIYSAEIYYYCAASLRHIVIK